MNRYVIYGLVVIPVLILDQITKAVALAYAADDTISVLPFLNWVLVWNRGISFGLFNDGGALGPWLLSGLSLVIVAVLTVWLVKAKYLPLGIAISAVIGGAVGNVIDRVRFGAVVDFIDLHAFGYHWPAFNIADSCIVLGIAFIVLDGLFFEPKRQGLRNESEQI